MKLHPLIFLLMLCSAQLLCAQSAPKNCAEVLALARDKYDLKLYDEANRILDDVEACDPYNHLSMQRQELRREVNIGIQKQREEAQLAEQKARQAAGKARKAEDSLRNVLEELDRTQDSLQTSANKTLTLERSLHVTDNILAFVQQQARAHFQYNALLIRRDYQAALTNFALANFLETDSLEWILSREMVEACKLGIKADEFFKSGKLDSAEVYYHKTIQILSAIDQNTAYEQARLEHIREVRDLARDFFEQFPVPSDSLVLEGDWWTLPEQFYEFQAITKLVLNNNSAVREDWTFKPSRFPNLASLRVRNCPNLLRLEHWHTLPNLSELEIQDNERLELIDSLGQLTKLSKLTISKNPSLKSVQGLESLHELVSLKIVRNRFLTKLGQLPNAQTLRHLWLSGAMEEVELNLAQQSSLQTIQVSELPKLERLTGLDSLLQIKSVTITHNPKFTALGNLSNSNTLEALTISGNSSLVDLRGIDNLTRLERITIDSNIILKRIPPLRSFSQLTEITMRDNLQLLHFGYLIPLQHLKKAEITGNKRFFMAILGLAPGVLWGGQKQIDQLPRTQFALPSLTLTGSVKWIRASFVAEYSFLTQNYYFHNQSYDFTTRAGCGDYFESIKMTNPAEYEKKEICDANVNRLRLFLTYDIYPFLPLGPTYYMGLGVNASPWSNFPLLLATGARVPIKSNYISLDARFDFSELYRPHHVNLLYNISIGYNFRLGFKKTNFRENTMMFEGKMKPRRLF